MTARLVSRLPRLRRLWASTLDTTGVVTHTALVADGAGGYGPGTATTNTYACRVQPASPTPAESLQGGGVVAVDEWDVQLPHDAVIEARDTVTVGGTLYQVQGVTTGRSLNYGRTARCIRGQQ